MGFQSARQRPAAYAHKKGAGRMAAASAQLICAKPFTAPELVGIEGRKRSPMTPSGRGSGEETLRRHARAVQRNLLPVSKCYGPVGRNSSMIAAPSSRIPKSW